MAGEKLLIVDDNRASLAACRRALVGEGYELQTVDNGLEALERLRHDPPHLVVLDLSLRDIDGWSLLGQVVRSSPDVPVILHSSFPCFGEFRSWAADAFVLKSGDLRNLKRTIRRLLDDEARRPYRERRACAPGGAPPSLPSPMAASEFARLSVLSTIGEGAY